MSDESLDESVEESSDESVEESFDESVKESSDESSIENTESTDNLIEDVKKTTKEIKDDETKDIVDGESESVADIATDSEINFEEVLSDEEDNNNLTNDIISTDSEISSNELSSNELNLDVATASIINDKLFGDVDTSYILSWETNLTDATDWNLQNTASFFGEENVSNIDLGAARVTAKNESGPPQGIIRISNGNKQKYLQGWKYIDPDDGDEMILDISPFPVTHTVPERYFDADHKLHLMAIWSEEYTNVEVSFHRNYLDTEYELWGPNVNPSYNWKDTGEGRYTDVTDTTGVLAWGNIGDGHNMKLYSVDHEYVRKHLGWSTTPTRDVVYALDSRIPYSAFSDPDYHIDLYAVWSDEEEKEHVTFWATDMANLPSDIYNVESGTMTVHNFNSTMWDYSENILMRRKDSPQAIGVYKFNVGETYDPYHEPDYIIRDSYSSSWFSFFNDCSTKWYHAGFPTESYQLGLCYKKLHHIEISTPPTKSNYLPGEIFDDLDGLVIRKYYTNSDIYDVGYYRETIAYTEHPDEFRFVPAKDSALPDLPQHMDVRVIWCQSYLNHEYECTNTFPISVADSFLELKIRPDTRGKFNDTLSASKFFISSAEFNNFKTQLEDDITINEEYQYVNKWSDGTTDNINIQNYNWNGTERVELTTHLLPLLKFVINDADFAKGSITSTKTVFNNTEKTVFLNNGVTVDATEQYVFSGWKKKELQQ